MHVSELTDFLAAASEVPEDNTDLARVVVDVRAVERRHVFLVLHVERSTVVDQKLYDVKRPNEGRVM